MSRSFTIFAVLFFAVSLISLSGCQDSASLTPAMLEHRTSMLLNDEPDGVLQVLEVRETLLGNTEEESHDHAHEHDGDEHEHAHHEEDEHHEHEHEEGDEEDHEHAHHEDDEDHGHDEHAHDDHEEDHEHEHGDDDHDHADHDHANDVEDDVEEADISLPTESIEVVVMGQIGGLANPWSGSQPEYPFAKNEAKLFLSDAGEVAEAEAEGHVHAPGEECAFCAAHAKDNSEVIAVVRFVDDNGKVLAADARKLFDLKERDTVVVRGTAHVDEGGILTVNATGVYVRR